VEVYAHGWLEKTQSLYFIDMEYCSETLKARIGSGVPKFAKHNDAYVKRVSAPPTESLEQKANGISRSSNCAKEDLDTSIPIPKTREDGSAVLDFDFESVVEIVEDIVSGLIYLHEHKTVHRDLKPGNSRFDISKLH